MKNVMRFLSAFAALSFSSLYAVSQESAAFLEPTVVTVVEKATGNDIKDEKPSVCTLHKQEIQATDDPLHRKRHFNNLDTVITFRGLVALDQARHLRKFAVTHIFNCR